MHQIFKDHLEYHNQNGLEYMQFKKLLQYPEIVHCYTLRGKENNLNFPSANRDEKTLKQSYAKICKQLHLDPNKVIKPYQTHTDKVEIVNEVKKLEQIDGLLTQQEGLVLLTTSADCTSLLFYDPENKAIGSVHSGWRGTLQAISKKTVEKMVKEFGSRPQDIICCICPCIKQCCFEVDQEVRDLFYEQYQNMKDIEKIIVRGQEKDGKQKYFIDTTKINQELLLQAGLKIENIIDSGICTMCHPEYFHSYRAEKENSGRNAALMSLICH